jgi:putative transposase
MKDLGRDTLRETLLKSFYGIPGDFQEDADASWSEFRRQLDYKCRKLGSNLVVAPRFFASSKLCCCCGHRMETLTLSVRDWKCPVCGEHHDRDINAAKNLLNWYLSTVSSTGIQACGVPSDGSALFSGADSYGTLKQESSFKAAYGEL